MFQPLGSIIRDSLPESSVARSISAAMVVEFVNETLAKLFGETIVEHAQAAFVKDKVLSIACLDPIASQEIKLHEKVIIEAVVKKFGKNALEKVTYII